MKSKQEIINAISDVQHPAITNSLLNLGIVKDIEIEDNTAVVTFAFPFPNIPIADQLINSISQPIKAIGLEFMHIVVTMNEEEKAKFMQLETEGWKGM